MILIIEIEENLGRTMWHVSSNNRYFFDKKPDRI